MSIWSVLLDLLFPPRCPFCGKIQDKQGVCSICQKNLPVTREGESVRLLGAGLRCAAPLWYEDLARQGLLRFKFHDGISAADCLGEMIARCAAEAFYGEFDLVTWVPVSRRRLRRRGYDQAELLARAACRVWQTEPSRRLPSRDCGTPRKDATMCWRRMRPQTRRGLPDTGFCSLTIFAPPGPHSGNVPGCCGRRERRM